MISSISEMSNGVMRASEVRFDMAGLQALLQQQAERELTQECTAKTTRPRFLNMRNGFQEPAKWISGACKMDFRGLQNWFPAFVSPLAKTVANTYPKSAK